jgi:predicted metal-dependent hydrolase
MSETIQIGDVSILVNRKAVKNVHLSVHPPTGRITLVAPNTTHLEVARAYAISKLGWIREQQLKQRNTTVEGRKSDLTKAGTKAAGYRIGAAEKLSTKDP